ALAALRVQRPQRGPDRIYREAKPGLPRALRRGAAGFARRDEKPSESPPFPDKVVMARAQREPDFVGLAHVDRRVERHERIELLDVRDRHPDAAVRRCRPERRDLVGAVDPGAVVEAEPARLDRVFGAGWDNPPGEVTCPGAVRDVPGRVHLTVVDLVLPRRRLEPLPADRDRVRPG